MVESFGLGNIMTNNIDFDSIFGVNSLDYIKTHIAQQSLVILGKSCPENTSYAVNGDVAVYKALGGNSAKTKSSGIAEDMSPDNASVSLKTITLDDYIGFCVNIDSITLKNTPDLAKKYIMDSLALSVRKFNEKYITKLQGSGNQTFSTDTSTLTYSNIGGKILADIAKFKRENKEYGLTPKICYISPENEALLIEALGPALKKDGTTEIAYKGYIGSIFGVDFISCDQLAVHTSTTGSYDVDYILVGEESTLCPFIDLGEPTINPYISGGFGKVQVLWKKPIGFGIVDAKRVIAHKSNVVS